MMDNIMGLIVKALKQMTADLLQLLERMMRPLMENCQANSFCMGKDTVETLQELVRRMLDKLSRVQHLLRDALGFVMLKLDEVQMPSVGKFTSDAADLFTSDTLYRLLHDIQHFFASIADKFQEVFNPETLAVIVHWGLVVALAVVGLLCGFYAFGFIWMAVVCVFHLVCRVLYYLFVGLYHCCLLLLKGLLHVLLFVMRVCCGCLGLMGIAMMKAPGTAGLVIIPRCLFLYCPRYFFRVLRSISELLVDCADNKFIVTSLGVGIVCIGLKLAGVF